MQKISKKWIEDWARKYDEENPEEKKKEDRIFNSIRRIGSPPTHITKKVLKRIADWKAARILGYTEKNNPKFVEEVTRVSLATNNEKLRLEVLTLLNGVGVRMASAILRFCLPDQYTVMDWRAWESLKKFSRISEEIEDTYKCYREYNELCHKISKQFHVTLRTLDKALWQWAGGKSE